MNKRKLSQIALAAAVFAHMGAAMAQPVAKSASPSTQSSAITAGSPSKFSFLVYGDSRAGGGCAGNAVHISLVKRMVDEPAAFVFNTGDIVTGFDRSTNWINRGDCPDDASKGSFKEIIAPLQNKAPAPGLPMFYFPVLGNHDDNWGDGWYPDKFGNGFCDVFNPRPLIPNHTRASYFMDKSARVAHFPDSEFYSLACSTSIGKVYPAFMYYSFNYGNSHFVVMRHNNDNSDLEVCNISSCIDPTNYDQQYNRHQLDWLKADLAAASARPSIENIFVLLHVPLFTASWGHPANVSWPTLSREFSKYKVRMVFSGHNHVYERSHPIYASPELPNGIRDNRRGTVYLVTGGGGSSLHGFNKANPLMAAGSADYHYLRIEVNGTQVSVKAIKPDGTVFDSYSR